MGGGLRVPVGRVVKTNGYCKKVLVPRGRFDPRSFRTVSPNKSTRITIGCIRGKWDSIRKRCKIGTQAQRIMKKKTKAGTCPRM